jgi:DNA repair ATPase RecN
MQKIKIDVKAYDLDTFSDKCKAQLCSLQYLEQELAHLQAQVAALQTAMTAYSKALHAFLPAIGGSDTIKLS